VHALNLKDCEAVLDLSLEQGYVQWHTGLRKIMWRLELIVDTCRDYPEMMNEIQ
jgi:hypothetical protein